MIDRRDLLLGTAAAAAVAASAVASTAKAAGAGTVDVKMDPWNMSQEHQLSHAVDFPRLDADSYQDFANGFRRFLGRQGAANVSTAEIETFLRSKGLSSLDDTTMTPEQCYNLMMQDRVYATKVRLQRSTQTLMWDRARRAFYRDADLYLAAMEATDKAGPGRLELNPALDIPDYARYEIHTQPGGYVGDPFAGWVYHYALNAGFYRDVMHGNNTHDEIFHAMAQSHPLPADGKVRRILDIGCGCGQYTTALKERFPEAEVWGVEVGGPMVRYAHHRTVKLGLNVNYAQRLAEDTKFPDNYFDLVTDHILFHEVSSPAAQKIIAETHRVLRPGGVFYHLDVGTEGNPLAPPAQTITAKAFIWANFRHNVEPWWPEYVASDFPGFMRKAGFEVNLNAPAQRANLYPSVIGTKPA